MSHDYVLTLACPDRAGLVHAVTCFLLEQQANITESQQFGDREHGRWFMRIGFQTAGRTDAETLRAAFAATARVYDMTYELWSAGAPYRTLVMVSKQLHCLNDLLFRTTTGDLQIEVPALTAEELLSASTGEPSASVRERVSRARERQRRRGALNAMLSNAGLREHCALDAAGRRLVADAVDRGGMSARAVHRALRVARTIADLADEERVTMMHVAEAIQYRAYESQTLG